MGGRALKNTTTRRYERIEFEEISKELIDTLSKKFKKVTMPLFYKNKETFGDADILVSMEGYDKDFDIRDYITTVFEPNEIFHNGTCWSFDYKELQVDIITCEPEHFDSNAMYLSYNDLGNFIGRLAHGLGLKYGQEGLWYEHTFKGKNIGTIQVSKDYPKIFNFLGLSYERYQQGFNELEEIFTFIAESKYFNWKMFQMDQLNKINRDRNKKRASYVTFLEWMDINVADENHEYKFADDKTSYFIMINDEFPEADIITQVRRLEYLECRKLYVQSKFNGGDVMRRYGFEGKKLGDVLTGFKDFISSEYSSYNDYIIHNDTFDIYKDFEDYISKQTTSNAV
jgi:hypothetical protein